MQKVTGFGRQVENAKTAIDLKGSRDGIQSKLLRGGLGKTNVSNEEVLLGTRSILRCQDGAGGDIECRGGLESKKDKFSRGERPSIKVPRTKGNLAPCVPGIAM